MYVLVRYHIFDAHAMFQMICLKIKLTTLDVGNNFIKEIENLSHLSNLEEFWVCLYHLAF